MTKNVGQSDRVIRIILAILLAIVGYYYTTGFLMYAAYLISFVSLVTGITGFCPLYKLLGVDTNHYSSAHR